MAEAIRQPGAECNLTSQPEAQPAPAPCDRADWLSFGITTAIALSVYLFTLAPNLTLEDSGILSVSAMYAGVSSPPGYPAWTIYSWLFTKLLPFSNIAWRVAVGSAVATALACGLVAMMVSHSGPILFTDTPACSQLKPLEQRSLRGVCGGIAGLLLAFSGVVWDMAVVAEIRALSLLLFVGALCLLTRWILEPERRWPLFATFFLLGLLLTESQEMIVVLPGLVGAIIVSDRKLGRDVALTVLPLAVTVTAGNQWGVWIVFPSRLNWPITTTFAFVFVSGIILAIRCRGMGSEWKAAMLCGTGLLMGLTLYLYVPIASMTNPPVNWGYPRTVEGFFHVLARGQFERAWPTSGLWIFGRQLLIYGETAITKVGWPCVTLAMLSLCLIRRMSRAGRRWMLGLLAVWLGVAPLMVAELNPPPDRQPRELIVLYFTASHALLVLWAGAGMIWLGATATQTDEKSSTNTRPTDRVVTRILI
jgi:hypothetical protein